MAKLPEQDTTTKRIFELYEKSANNDYREHLGASVIGEECERKLWLTFRWAKEIKHEGRVLRLFESGKREESRVLQNLRDCMFEVLDTIDGKQINYSLFGDHFGGSVDGMILGIPEAPKTWHLVELKTHNDRSFKDLVKKGVRESKPVYWAQMQMYMGMSQTQGPHPLNRALYIGVNKNDDSMHYERFEYDKDAFSALKGKALRIIEAVNPPPRASDTPTKPPCVYCAFKSFCHAPSDPLPIEDLPSINCRNCLHSTPGLNGDWACELRGEGLSLDRQRVGCGEHLFHPEIYGIPYIVSASADKIKYSNGLVNIKGRGWSK